MKPVPKRTLDVEEATRDWIMCLRQPGRLRISRHACALRHLKAHQPRAGNPRDELEMARDAGLNICRSCPEGKAHARVLKEGPRPNHGKNVAC
jgi:hypothetical protein